MNYQSGILAKVPAHARYLFYSLAAAEEIAGALAQVKPLVDGERTLLGLGQSALQQLGKAVPGMRDFPACSRGGD